MLIKDSQQPPTKQDLEKSSAQQIIYKHKLTSRKLELSQETTLYYMTATKKIFNQPQKQ